jgi:hypothetical protein
MACEVRERVRHRDRVGTVELPIATSEPPRKAVPLIPACVFAGPDEGCVTDHRPQDVPRGLPPTLHVVAVSLDRRLVVGHLVSHACAFVTAADLHETPTSAREDVRFADNHTIVVAGRPPLARLLDADTGVELGRGDHITWLGGGLASVWRRNEIDIVEGAILDAASLVAIDSSSIITIRLDAKPGALRSRSRSRAFSIQLRTDRRAPPKAAVIRLSTGRVVAR